MKNRTMSEDTNYLLKCTVSFFPAESHTTFLSFFMLQYSKVKKIQDVTCTNHSLSYKNVPFFCPTAYILPVSYLALWRGQQTSQVLCARLLVTMFSSTMVKKTSQGGTQTKGTAAFQQGLECLEFKSLAWFSKLCVWGVNLTAEYDTLCRFYT